MLVFALCLYNILSDMNSNITWNILFLWWYKLWNIYEHTFHFLKTGCDWTSRAPRSKRLARKCGMYAPVYFPICALISLFNMFSFPFRRVYYQIQKSMFHFPFLWLNWKIWRHMGMVYPWNIFLYSFVARGRHGTASFLTKLSKAIFSASSSKEKLQCLLSLWFCFLCLIFICPFLWKHDFLIQKLHGKLPFLLWKHVSIWSYNQSLEIHTVSSLLQ